MKCNTTNWNEQVSLFKEAVKLSPEEKVDYVVANAGVAPRDDTFSFGECCFPFDALHANQVPKRVEADEPIEPSLTTIDINTKGTLYTTKLALHHFVKQNGDSSVASTTPPTSSRSDTCLILIGSGAGFLDVPRSPEYCCTKFGNRGIMHSMRRITHHYQSRVNVISPWYVRTKILTTEVFDHVQGSGVDFAEAEDAGQCLLRILSDDKVNGHSFFIAPRKWASRGYVDLGLEEEAESSDLLKEMQKMQMASAPPDSGLFP